MPAYDYRCRSCDTAFEVRRPLSEPAPAMTPCPQGHADTTRVFSAVAVGGGSAVAAPAAPVASGGCCGGGCCG